MCQVRSFPCEKSMLSKPFRHLPLVDSTPSPLQVWRDMPYDAKSDMWSLGCVLYEMAWGLSLCKVRRSGSCCGKKDGSHMFLGQCLKRKHGSLLVPFFKFYQIFFVGTGMFVAVPSRSLCFQPVEDLLFGFGISKSFQTGKLGWVA